ncbi:MAG TPA: right-handed parallel beta-helix repeat-containing protein [Bryobacteraceae bacterium]|nr:right-handed parallel beta-helix repeat-containing protein [Bryobacteraceae bacterium]
MMRIAAIGCLATLIWAFTSCSTRPVRQGPAQTRYVDCAANSNAIAELNAWTLGPGDRVLFKRGTQCKGSLLPNGSGTAEQPIIFGAYGEGPLPVVDARGQRFALKLWNQEGWRIENLDLMGGNESGVFVSGNGNRVLRHFRFRNLKIHGVRGTALSKRRGLLAIAPNSPFLTFSDIEIDGVTAYDSTQWVGIVVDGGYPSTRLKELPEWYNRILYRYWHPESLRAKNVVIRNSIVHDVQGDGMILMRVEDGVIESSLAWKIGQMEAPLMPGQNPVAIWEWRCTRCVIRNSEAMLADTPAVDAGAFDIDWESVDSSLEGNYAHDNQGYCVSVFGGMGKLTRNSVVKNNVCVNNGRSPKLAARQGDVYIATWFKGTIDGFDIHHNTFVWNPPVPVSLIHDGLPEEGVSKLVEGGPSELIRGNVFLSRLPVSVEEKSRVQLGHNLTWLDSHGQPSGFDPLLRPTVASVTAGALLPATEPLPPRQNGAVLLRIYVDPQRPETRANLQRAWSASVQYGREHVGVEVVMPQDASNNLPFDWHFSELKHRRAAVAADGPLIEIDGKDGRVLHTWKSTPHLSEIDLMLRWLVGDPLGSPSLEWIYKDREPKLLSFIN